MAFLLENFLLEEWNRLCGVKLYHKHGKTDEILYPFLEFSCSEKLTKQQFFKTEKKIEIKFK